MTMNMSYCRFQNTLAAFKECTEDIGDMMEGRSEALSREERRACCQLAEEALTFLQLLCQASPNADWQDDDGTTIEDYDISDDAIESSVNAICETAGSDED